MAFSKKKYGRAIKLLNEELPQSGEEVVFKNVKEILEPVVDDHYYLAQGYLDTLKRHRARNHNKGNGFGYCVVNRTEEENPIAYTIMATGGSGKERNLIYQPKPGVAGKIIVGKKTPLNSEGIRVMTPKEWGRLQGFVDYAFVDENGVDHFSFPDGTTDGQKYKQFGNSVSIPVIKTMAEFMLKCFEILQNQQTDVVNALVSNNIFFTKKHVMELLDINAQQAGLLLKGMIEKKQIARVSNGKTTRYAKYQENLQLPPYSQEEKVLEMTNQKMIVTNADVQQLLKTTKDSANVLLSEMVRKGLLYRASRGKYHAMNMESRNSKSVGD